MEWEESFKNILPKVMKSAYDAAEIVNKKMLKQTRVREEERLFPSDVSSAALGAAEKIINPWIDKNLPIVDPEDITIVRKIGGSLSDVVYKNKKYVLETIDTFSIISGLRKVLILDRLKGLFPEIKMCMASRLRRDQDLKEEFDGSRNLYIFYEFIPGLDYPDPMEDFNDRQMAILMYIFYVLLKKGIYISINFIFSNPDDYIWLDIGDIFTIDDTPYDYRKSLEYLDHKYDYLSTRRTLMIDIEHVKSVYIEEMDKYYYVDSTRTWAEKLFACFSKELDILDQQ